MEDLVQLLFSVPDVAADAVCNLLTEEGGGVEQRDSETTPSLGTGVTNLLVWTPSSEVSRRVQAVENLLVSLKEMGTPVDPWSWTTEQSDPKSWQETYKRYFTVNRLGKYVVVKPSWEEYTPGTNDLLIELDPGMAFGTGLHASTRLVIHILERLARSSPSPLSVLDMGCGSGILAIAAARLWPNVHIEAIDNDELAVQVCQENVVHNKLENRITAHPRSGSQVEGKFDLILANISSETLTELQPQMHQCINNFGRLVMSGLLTEQAGPLCRLYCKDLIWEPEYSESMDEWTSLLLRLH